MLLLIDAGNTAIKWRVYRGSQLFASGTVYNSAVELSDDALASASKSIQLIRIAVVSQDELLDKFLAVNKLASVAREYAYTQAQSPLGLTNAYADYSSMGVDRWLAMLAAVSSAKVRDVLVVDAGSAITVDAVSGGRHIGGYITPGLAMHRRSLLLNTARVAVTNSGLNDAELGFGSTTQDCVNAGIYAMVKGMLALAINNSALSFPKLFITGGDAHIIAKLIGANDHDVYDNLVLDGLLVFTN